MKTISYAQNEGVTPVVEVEESKCVNCHRCITVCPVKYCNDGSGSFVSLNPQLCIGCGACVIHCEHGARIAIDDFPKFISDLQEGKKIVAIVAPAVVANFPGKDRKINGWLKSLGVEAIFDVSFGAELTVKSYLEHVKNNSPKCVIAQPCPALVSYIQIYKPNLIKHLAPADSPMMHTMKMIREFYPDFRNHHFVILSPCIAKRREFDEVGIGDYNITFNAIEEYLRSNKINIDAYEEVDFDNPPAERAALFSTPGGLMRTAEREAPGIIHNTRKIEGREQIYAYLDKLEHNVNKGISPLLIDCLNCHLGCNGGPGTKNAHACPDEVEHLVEKRARANQQGYQKRGKKADIKRLRKYVEKNWKPGLYDRKYTDFSSRVDLKIPNPRELDEINQKTHKVKEEDFLNCGSCGYEYCEDMAVAIFNGLNRPENCRHFSIAEIEIEKQQILDSQTEAVERRRQLKLKNEKTVSIVSEINDRIRMICEKSEIILQRCDNSSSISSDAHKTAENSVSQIRELEASSKKVGDVLSAIEDIADQTNLLALNATIEAASAGEAGKGFSVVANEVKELAKSSNSSVNEVGRNLENMLQNTKEAVELMKKVTSNINEFDGISIEIASLIRDQDQIVHEIEELGRQELETVD